jgi:hypothetical protein
MLLAGVLSLVLAVQIEGSISAPQARANAAIGEMGRKPKGKGVNTPKWEHRDDISPFKLAEKLYVCVCVCVCIIIHICVCVCVDVYVYVYVYIYVYMYLCVYIEM